MNKKIVGILVCMLLIIMVLPASGTVDGTAFELGEYLPYTFSEDFGAICDEIVNPAVGKSEEEILREIDETSDKSLEVDEVIGERHVKFWEHKIDDVQIKNDYILLHRDIYTNRIVEYVREWREVDTESLHFEYEYFEPEDIFWQEKVIFLNDGDKTYFYSFDDSQEYPIDCWEVRHTDGTTIMYDYNGNEIGYGAPTPSRGFSLSGCFENLQPKCLYWEILRKNADNWFSKWCDSTISLSLPTPNTISNYVKDQNVEYFYELAHGGSYYFQADIPYSFYYSSDVNNDMTNRQPMKFAFIGSCQGMTNTGPGTFSHEFRKGQMINTVTVGYDHMENSNGFYWALQWQNYMFRKMNQGYTMKKSFDLASARFPLIAPAVVFVGDATLKTVASLEQSNALTGAEATVSSVLIHAISNPNTHHSSNSLLLQILERLLKRFPFLEHVLSPPVFARLLNLLNIN